VLAVLAAVAGGAAACEAAPDDLVLVCDVREPDCHRELFRTVGDILGRRTLETVPVVLLTPEEWVAEEIDRIWPTGGVRDAIEADALFEVGLLRERLASPSRASVESLGGQLAALYGGTPRRIVVLVPGAGAALEPEDASSTLVHEIVHAYQDDAFRIHDLLGAFGEAGDIAGDHLLRAAVEGQALLVQGVLETRRRGVPTDALDWWAWVKGIDRNVLARVEAARSPFLEARWSIWYAAGLAMAVSVFEESGGDVRATDELIRRPPPSVASLLSFLWRTSRRVALEQRETPLTLPLPPTAPPPLLTATALETWALSWYASWRLDGWDLALLVAPEKDQWWTREVARSCADAAMEVFLTEDGDTVTVLRSRWLDAGMASDVAAALEALHADGSWKRCSGTGRGVVRSEESDVVLVVSPDEALSAALADVALPPR
jgi:hypothetical protein